MCVVLVRSKIDRSVVSPWRVSPSLGARLGLSKLSTCVASGALRAYSGANWSYSASLYALFLPATTRSAPCSALASYPDNPSASSVPINLTPSPPSAAAPSSDITVDNEIAATSFLPRTRSPTSPKYATTGVTTVLPRTSNTSCDAPKSSTDVSSASPVRLAGASRRARRRHARTLQQRRFLHRRAR